MSIKYELTRSTTHETMGRWFLSDYQFQPVIAADGSKLSASFLSADPEPAGISWLQFFMSVTQLAPLISLHCQTSFMAPYLICFNLPPPPLAPSACRSPTSSSPAPLYMLSLTSSMSLLLSLLSSLSCTLCRRLPRPPSPSDITPGRGYRDGPHMDPYHRRIEGKVWWIRLVVIVVIVNK